MNEPETSGKVWDFSNKAPFYIVLHKCAAFALFQGNICVAAYSVYSDTSAWPESHLEENKLWIIYLPITVTDSSVAGLQSEPLLPFHDSWLCNCGRRVFQACSLPAHAGTWSIALIASMGQETSTDCRVKRAALAPLRGQHTGATVEHFKATCNWKQLKLVDKSLKWNG